jgi:AcrR family transcriptional regulator
MADRRVDPVAASVSESVSDPAADSELYQEVLAAAVDELAARGVEKFTIEGVAARCGVAADVITRTWKSQRVLLLEASLLDAEKSFMLPDTGSLTSDLLIYVNQVVDGLMTPKGRRLLYALLPTAGDWDLSEIRSDFWDRRLQTMSIMVRRAAARGEVRDGVDPVKAMGMFMTALRFEPLYRDEAVSTEFAAHSLDIFLHGILKHPPQP